MSRLPAISGRECVKVLEKIAFTFNRQEGSHIIMRRHSPFAQMVVPDHKVLDRGNLRAIMRQAGLSLEELLRHL